MEIHPPEGPVRSVKDFAVHLSMITLGIVIALSLEGALEMIHHHEQVAELRRSFRAEMTDNRTALVQWAAAMGPVTGKIEGLLAPPPHDAAQPAAALSGLGVHFVALKAGARDVALSLGTLNLMDLDEVHSIVNVYTAQRAFEERQGRLEAVWFELTGQEGDLHPTDADAHAAVTRLRMALAYLRSLTQLQQDAIAAYDEALKVVR